MQIVTAAASDPQCIRKGEGDSIELRDGRLLLAYMEFAGDGSDKASTRIVAVESNDGGLTWGKHRIITTTAAGEVNVYSPNLIRAADGGILLLFMRQKSVKPEQIATHYVWKSSNEGASFEPFSEFARDENFSLCNAVIKRLSNGRLLLPTNAVDESSTAGYLKRGSAAVFYSDDDGRTWREAANRARLPMRGAMEPHVQETRDGRVLMVMRNQLGSMFMCESSDDGITWSKPQTTGLSVPESCPEITQIPSTGDLLLIWNNSPYDPQFISHYGKRSPLTSAVSRDQGRTWQHFLNIETDPTRAFSNPGCRFTRDGKAIVNYWTCEYSAKWHMQDVIDLRVALIDTAEFYA